MNAYKQQRVKYERRSGDDSTTTRQPVRISLPDIYWIRKKHCQSGWSFSRDIFCFLPIVPSFSNQYANLEKLLKI